MEHFHLTVVRKHTQMAPPSAELQTLRDLFKEDLVDHESDSQFVGTSGSPLTTITDADDDSRAFSSFLEPGAADTLTALRTLPELTSTAEVITNPLDEQQKQHAKSALSLSQRP